MNFVVFISIAIVCIVYCSDSGFKIRFISNFLLTLSVKDFQFRPMLSAYDHWAVRVLKRAKPTVTQNFGMMVSSEGPGYKVAFRRS